MEHPRKRTRVTRFTAMHTEVKTRITCENNQREKRIMEPPFTQTQLFIYTAHALSLSHHPVSFATMFLTPDLREHPRSHIHQSKSQTHVYGSLFTENV